MTMLSYRRHLMAVMLVCCGVMELLSAYDAPWSRSRRLAAFRSDLGRKRGHLDEQELEYDGEGVPAETERRSAAFRSDLGKRLASFRSDLGKRPLYSFRSDLGKRRPSEAAAEDEKRFAFRSDLGKRAAFRSDLGKRFEAASKKASSAFRSDLGKRLAAFRSDLGKRF